MSARFLPILGLAYVFACASEDATRNPTPDAGTTPEACDKNAKTCEGDAVRECVADARGKLVSRLRACGQNGTEEVCRDGACGAPTDAQYRQVKRIEAMLDQLAQVTSYPTPLDYGALKAEARRETLHGDGSDLAFLAAAYHAFLGVPEGHQSFIADYACGKSVPYASTSRFGVCGRPYQSDAIVVTVAHAGNKLGLNPGDRVTKVGDLSGSAMFDTAALALKCGSSFVSKAYRDTEAAGSFFATIAAGAKLTVVSPDGQTRVVTVPTESDAQLTDCLDPLGRSRKVIAEAKTLPDGTGVIRIPAFTPYDEQFPANPTPEQVSDFIQRFQDRIHAEFVKVQSAPRLIWDLRSNSGGITLVGLAIASGMPGANGAVSTYCNARVPKSNPPAFSADKYAVYALTPGGPFAYSGKVAVLVDGYDYSAADYTSYFAKNATSVKLIGSSTAGAFGGAGPFFRSTDTPSFTVYYDTNKCMDSAGNPLEGKSTEPHVAVEYDPADLAQGKDTVLNRAIAELQ